jgi:aminoglycoside phosphotransferase (APT) family kinase protein
LSVAARDAGVALAWAEEVTGGKITRVRRQARWRPHLFLDVDTGSAEPLKLMLRGFRNPGYLDDEASSRTRLRKEAGVLRCLQHTPVKVPRYYGFNEEHSWILMEWVQGTELLTEVEDPELRHGLFRQYMENVALLHTLDHGQLDLPPELPAPRTDDEIATGKFDRYVAMYRSYPAGDPEPLLELGIRWIQANVPASSRPLRFCAGDIGPNQFIFREGVFRSMFDLEIAQLGDPLADLGLMRLREMCYPIGRLPEHIRHWSQASGLELDLDVLQYWTMVGMVGSPVLFWHAVQRPSAVLVDQMALYSFVPIHRRGTAESLAEIHGIGLERPERPPERETPRSSAHRLMVRHFEEKYIPEARDDEQRFFLECSAALAEHLALGNALGPRLESETFEELSALLGHRPADRRAGLAALEEAVRRDPERDLEARLRFLYRMEVRAEYLWEPIQRAMGFASNWPLTRMNG